MSNTRKIILIIVIAFVVYAVFTRPGQSADTVDSGWNYVERATTSIGVFFERLLS